MQSLSRVFVPFGCKPPRGVLWVDGVALVYHARAAGYSRTLGVDMPAEPARMDEFRQIIRDYVAGKRVTGGWWGYYKGRRLACPYRCALDSTECPVDVLIEEINKPRRRSSGTQKKTPTMNAGVGLVKITPK